MFFGYTSSCEQLLVCRQFAIKADEIVNGAGRGEYYGIHLAKVNLHCILRHTVLIGGDRRDVKP